MSKKPRYKVSTDGDVCVRKSEVHSSGLPLSVSNRKVDYSGISNKDT
jgi:hypothetical protein